MEPLTNIPRLLRILMVRQVVTRYEDRNSATVLQRQADLVALVQVHVPEYGQVNRVVCRHSAHEGELRQSKPQRKGKHAVGERRREALPDYCKKSEKESSRRNAADVLIVSHRRIQVKMQ